MNSFVPASSRCFLESGVALREKLHLGAPRGDIVLGLAVGP